jgi:hypothetical protein
MLNNIYGNKNTEEFFLQELDNDLNDKENNIDDAEDVPELDMTPKLKLEDVENTLTNVIHSEFDYNKYVEKDLSNERFLRKQINTNSLRDTLFDPVQQSAYETNNKEPELFTENTENVPF